MSLLNRRCSVGCRSAADLPELTLGSDLLHVELDEDLNVTLFNPAAEKVFHCASGDILGRSFCDFLAKESAGKLRSLAAGLSAGDAGTRHLWVPGGFTLRGTIGQPDAGTLTGDGFTLVGGFWQEAVRTNIPTVSEWGLVAMTLLVLSAGTVVLVRRRAAQAH